MTDQQPPHFSPSSEATSGQPGAPQHGAGQAPAGGPWPHQESTSQSGAVASVGPFTVRELVVIAAGALMFLLSFVSLTSGSYAPVWSLGLFWVPTIVLPVAAVILLAIRRFGSSAPTRVGSLSTDQFASVAFSVASLIWVAVLTLLVQITGALSFGGYSVGWVVWIQVLLALTGVFFTVVAPFVPPFRVEFDQRDDAPAARAARPAVTIVRPAQPATTAGAYAAPYGESPVADASASYSGSSGQPEHSGAAHAPAPATSAFTTLGDPAATQPPAPGPQAHDQLAPAPSDAPDSAQNSAVHQSEDDLSARAGDGQSDAEPQSVDVAESNPSAAPDDAREPAAAVNEADMLGHAAAEASASAGVGAEPAATVSSSVSPFAIGEGSTERPTTEQPTSEQPTSEQSAGEQGTSAPEADPVAQTSTASVNPQQPFWALAPEERLVYDAQGKQIFAIGPTAWALVLEDRGEHLVIRHDDGRIGYLWEVTGLTRG